MHELSLIDGIIGAVKTNAQENNIKRINKIKLVVGRFTNAIPDSLQFAFEVLSQQEPMFSGARLEIEERPVVCCCNDCGRQFEVDKTYRFRCPQCDGVNIEITSGRELYVDFYEGDEDDGTGKNGKQGSGS